MQKWGVCLTAVFFVFALCGTVRAEVADIRLPTGGYYRSGQTMPVSFELDAAASGASYSVSLKLSAHKMLSSEVLLNSINIKPHSTRKVVLPALIDARNPYLGISIRDGFSNHSIIEEDLSGRIRYLAGSDRLFIVSGILQRDLQLLDHFTIKDCVVKTQVTSPDTGVFDDWVYLEGVDAVVIFPDATAKWATRHIDAIRRYVELGGRIILCNATNNTAFISKLFPKIEGLTPGAIPRGYEVVGFESGKCAAIRYGLGYVVLFLDAECDSDSIKTCWKSAEAMVTFPASPVSLFPPLPDARLTAEGIAGTFRALDISQAYAQKLQVTIGLVFSVFIFIAAIIAILGLGGRIFVVIVAFGVVSVGLTYYINAYIPQPGIICQYRTIVETDAAGLGRVTIFTALNSATEMSAAVRQPDGRSTKVLLSHSDLLVSPPRNRTPDGPDSDWVIRGITTKRNAHTAFLTTIPLSSLPEGSWLTPLQINAEPAEVSSPSGTVFYRRYISSAKGIVKLGSREYKKEDFLVSVQPAPDFEPAEWNFLRTGASVCPGRVCDCEANLYWSKSEPGEMLASDSILDLPIARVMEIGPTLIFRPIPATVQPNGEKK